MSVAEALAANAQDPAGQNVARHQKLAWDEISANSAKVVSFIGTRAPRHPSLSIFNDLIRFGWT
jgi:hypothetical protein